LKQTLLTPARLMASFLVKPTNLKDSRTTGLTITYLMSNLLDYCVRYVHSRA